MPPHGHRITHCMEHETKHPRHRSLRHLVDLDAAWQRLFGPTSCNSSYWSSVQSARLLSFSTLPDGWNTPTPAATQQGNLSFLISPLILVAFTFGQRYRVPFHAAVYGTDHLFTQRLMCCRNAIEARKALLGALWASDTGAHALVSVGLFAFYALSVRSAHHTLRKRDRIFPVFILNEMPVGMKASHCRCSERSYLQP